MIEQVLCAIQSNMNEKVLWWKTAVLCLEWRGEAAVRPGYWLVLLRQYYSSGSIYRQIMIWL